MNTLYFKVIGVKIRNKTPHFSVINFITGTVRCTLENTTLTLYITNGVAPMELLRDVVPTPFVKMVKRSRFRGTAYRHYLLCISF